MALTNEQIDQLVAGGFLQPSVADAMKRQNVAMMASSVAPNGAGPIVGATMAAKSAQVAGLNAMGVAPTVGVNARPVVRPAPVGAGTLPPGFSVASPYAGRATTPQTGSTPGSYLAPVYAYEMNEDAKKNGGVLNAETGATADALAKVPKTSGAPAEAKTVDPNLVNGLQAVGAISPETADKLHAMNEEEKKKKKG